jgi:hypothetical protein
LTRNTQTGVRFAISAPRKSDCKSALRHSTMPKPRRRTSELR